ncbi:hypothetical protein [Mycolicibacterium hippocampi]|uniref:DUF4185 domain-containing protein n=1 Tax=Mycolicibacterium hippocampi TaxID=659824 RepID=A0A7I9ZPE7_9MYCO|nr:hypothetical protein [Mycolicibacterium hippocampi]GFH02627.1 hypothetical protein MHIP_31100 [Mycolicibacterium hippocampi]
MDAPDLWRAKGGSEHLLFDMGAGLGVCNVIGLGDPDVHLVDGRWTMFLGGFTTGFTVRIFTARLPTGHELDSNAWSLSTVPGHRRWARSLFRPPRFGAWDSHGTHTPSYVLGRDSVGNPLERIYYAGRGTWHNGGPRSRYSIGVAERRDGIWRRRDQPVLVGTAELRSVFEPLVRYEDGLWRLWFQWAPHEVGRGEQPEYRLCYTESRDGLAGWSTPVVVFDSDEGYFDNAVHAGRSGVDMLLARGSNLYGTEPFPAQGLWWVRSTSHSGARKSWTERPVQLLDAQSDPPAWLERGAFGPDFRFGRRPEDATTMYVFTSGTAPAPRWWPTAHRRLLRGRLPPVPAPFSLGVGRLTIPNAREVWQ